MAQRRRTKEHPYIQIELDNSPYSSHKGKDSNSDDDNDDNPNTAKGSPASKLDSIGSKKEVQIKWMNDRKTHGQSKDRGSQGKTNTNDWTLNVQSLSIQLELLLGNKPSWKCMDDM